MRVDIEIQKLIEEATVESEQCDAVCAGIFFESKIEAYEECLEICKAHMK